MDIEINGILPLSSFKIKHEEWPAIITYFIQEMLKKGILASDRCYSNYCQNTKSLKVYEESCLKIFDKVSKFLLQGNLKKKIEGPIKQMGFKRLT